MTMAGLHFDFFGHARGKLEKGISEQSFDLTVDEEGKRYRLRGFIDKLFLYKDTGLALIRDFKSSKSVFKGKEITDNLQDLIYSLAVKKLFPKFDKREVEFLFLKFDLHASGNVKMAEISEYELEGLELYLTGIQEYIDNFDEDDAVSNFAGSQGYPSDGTFGGPLMCGKDGYKISKGEPLLDKEGNPIVAYICPYRKPMNYYVLKNSEGKIVKSFFEEDKDKITPNLEDKETVDFIEYKGCPYWNRDPVEIDDFL